MTVEQPRSEPEIIPPSRTGDGVGARAAPGIDASASHERATVFVTRDGIHRVHVARLGPGGTFLLLLAIAIAVVVIVLALAGLVLVGMVVAAILVAAAVVAGFLQRLLRPR